MTRGQKTTFAALIAIVIVAGAAYLVYARNRGVVGVQTSRVVRQDLAQTVSANGEIKPKKYVNISANTMGRIVQLPVRERVNASSPSTSFRIPGEAAGLRLASRYRRRSKGLYGGRSGSDPGVPARPRRRRRTP